VNRSPGDRAQSETLSSLLLVAVVVISAGTFGAYYVSSTTDGAASNGDSPDDFDFAVEVTPDELRITHNGGSSAATADLQITVENTSGEYTYAFADGSIRGGDGNDQFDPGETWELSWSQFSGTDVTVRLTDEDAGTLLFRETLTVSATATDRPG
jgi:flagellin-like protein